MRNAPNRSAKISLVATLAVAALIPLASSDAVRAQEGEARTGEIVVRSGADGSILRRYTGTRVGDEFGTSVGFDVVPGSDTAQLVVGAPGFNRPKAPDFGTVWVVDEADASRVYNVAPTDLSEPVRRLGHQIVNLGHVRNAISAHWAVGAPSTPDSDILPTVILLQGGPGRLSQRARLEGPSQSLFGWDIAPGSSSSSLNLWNEFFGVGAPRQRNGSKAAAGAVHFFDSVTTGREWLRRGTVAAGHLGYSLRATGDVDGDGVTDLLVGAPGRTGRRPRGRVFVLSGADGTVLNRIDAPPDADLFGFSVATLDVTADGIVDWVIGAPTTDVGGLEDAGSLFVFSGADRSLLYRIDGTRANDWLGVSIGIANDFDGDGLLDLAAGSLAIGNGRGKTRRGRVVVSSSATGEPLCRFVGGAKNNYFGSRFFGTFTDLNDDSFSEMLGSQTNAEIAYLPQ